MSAPRQILLAYRRAGVQVDDSTLGQLFHRAAEAMKPLSRRLLELVSQKEIVQADETTERVQDKGKTRTAWLWSFIARDEAEKELISYVFSRSRSGETPLRVLGDTLGKLVADAYSGYNPVTVPGGRERAGCLAHLRRKFFEAQSSSPKLAKSADASCLADRRAAPPHVELGGRRRQLVTYTPREFRVPRPRWTISRARGLMTR